MSNLDADLGDILRGSAATPADAIADVGANAQSSREEIEQADDRDAEDIEEEIVPATAREQRIARAERMRRHRQQLSPVHESPNRECCRPNTNAHLILRAAGADSLQS